jgi:hypothetical protein
MFRRQMHHNLEKIFAKSILGNVYFLRTNYFHSVLFDKYKLNYSEIFKISDKLRGNFIWETDSKSFKDINIMNMKNKLTVFDTWSNKTLFTENLDIYKLDCRPYREPIISHSIFQNGVNISFKELNPKFYNDLIKNKEIISTNI